MEAVNQAVKMVSTVVDKKGKKSKKPVDNSSLSEPHDLTLFRSRRAVFVVGKDGKEVRVEGGGPINIKGEKVAVARGAPPMRKRSRKIKLNDIVTVVVSLLLFYFSGVNCAVCENRFHGSFLSNDIGVFSVSGCKAIRVPYTIDLVDGFCGDFLGRMDNGTLEYKNADGKVCNSNGGTERCYTKQISKFCKQLYPANSALETKNIRESQKTLSKHIIKHHNVMIDEIDQNQAIIEKLYLETRKNNTDVTEKLNKVISKLDFVMENYEDDFKIIKRTVRKILWAMHSEGEVVEVSGLQGSTYKSRVKRATLGEELNTLKVNVGGRYTKLIKLSEMGSCDCRGNKLQLGGLGFDVFNGTATSFGSTVGNCVVTHRSLTKLEINVGGKPRLSKMIDPCSLVLISREYEISNKTIIYVTNSSIITTEGPDSSEKVFSLETGKFVNDFCQLAKDCNSSIIRKIDQTSKVYFCCEIFENTSVVSGNINNGFLIVLGFFVLLFTIGVAVLYHGGSFSLLICAVSIMSYINFDHEILSGKNFEMSLFVIFIGLVCQFLLINKANKGLILTILIGSFCIKYVKADCTVDGITFEVNGVESNGNKLYVSDVTVIEGSCIRMGNDTLVVNNITSETSYSFYVNVASDILILETCKGYGCTNDETICQKNCRGGWNNIEYVCKPMSMYHSCVWSKLACAKCEGTGIFYGSYDFNAKTWWIVYNDPLEDNSNMIHMTLHRGGSSIDIVVREGQDFYTNEGTLTITGFKELKKLTPQLIAINGENRKCSEASKTLTDFCHNLNPNDNTNFENQNCKGFEATSAYADWDTYTLQYKYNEAQFSRVLGDMYDCGSDLVSEERGKHVRLLSHAVSARMSLTYETKIETFRVGICEKVKTIRVNITEGIGGNYKHSVVVISGTVDDNCFITIYSENCNIIGRVDFRLEKRFNFSVPMICSLYNFDKLHLYAKSETVVEVKGLFRDPTYALDKEWNVSNSTGVADGITNVLGWVESFVGTFVGFFKSLFSFANLKKLVILFVSLVICYFLFVNGFHTVSVIVLVLSISLSYTMGQHVAYWSADPFGVQTAKDIGNCGYCFGMHYIDFKNLKAHYCKSNTSLIDFNSTIHSIKGMEKLREIDWYDMEHDDLCGVGKGQLYEWHKHMSGCSLDEIVESVKTFKHYKGQPGMCRFNGSVNILEQIWYGNDKGMATGCKKGYDYFVYNQTCNSSASTMVISIALISTSYVWVVPAFSFICFIVQALMTRFSVVGRMLTVDVNNYSETLYAVKITEVLYCLFLVSLSYCIDEFVILSWFIIEVLICKVIFRTEFLLVKIFVMSIVNDDWIDSRGVVFDVKLSGSKIRNGVYNDCTSLIRSIGGGIDAFHAVDGDYFIYNVLGYDCIPAQIGGKGNRICGIKVLKSSRLMSYIVFVLLFLFGKRYLFEVKDGTCGLIHIDYGYIWRECRCGIQNGFKRQKCNCKNRNYIHHGVSGFDEDTGVLKFKNFSFRAHKSINDFKGYIDTKNEKVLWVGSKPRLMCDTKSSIPTDIENLGYDHIILEHMVATTGLERIKSDVVIWFYSFRDENLRTLVENLNVTFGELIKEADIEGCEPVQYLDLGRNSEVFCLTCENQSNAVITDCNFHACVENAAIAYMFMYMCGFDVRWVVSEEANVMELDDFGDQNRESDSMEEVFSLMNSGTQNNVICHYGGKCKVAGTSLIEKFLRILKPKVEANEVSDFKDSEQIPWAHEEIVGVGKVRWGLLQKASLTIANSGIVTNGHVVSNGNLKTLNAYGEGTCHKKIGNNVGDVVYYDNMIKHEKAISGKFYVMMTLNMIEGAVCKTAMKCIRSIGEKGCNYNQFVPVNLVRRGRDIICNEIDGRDWHGCSGSPIFNSNGGVVGIFGKARVLTAAGMPSGIVVNESVIRNSNMDSDEILQRCAEEVVSKTTSMRGFFLHAGTGVGKTTKFVCKLAQVASSVKKGTQICVCVPRRNATYAAYSSFCQMFKNQITDNAWTVNFTVGVSNENDGLKAAVVNVCASPNAIINYMTYGKFNTLNQAAIEVFDYLLLDEFHVRDEDCVYTDLFLDTIHATPKVVVMTATDIGDGFGTQWERLTEEKIQNMSKWTILEKDVGDFADMDKDKCFKIGSTNDEKMKSKWNYFSYVPKNLFTGRCLIFVPTIRMVDEFVEWIKTNNTLGNLGVFSSTSEKRVDIAALPDDCIVVTTDVLESSVNIPNCKLVLDYQRQNFVNRSLNLDEKTYVYDFITKGCSKYACEQRRGRTGRMCDGVYVRMAPTVLTEAKVYPESVLCNLFWKNTAIKNWVTSKMSWTGMVAKFAVDAARFGDQEVKSSGRNFRLLSELRDPWTYLLMSKIPKKLLQQTMMKNPKVSTKFLCSDKYDQRMQYGGYFGPEDEVEFVYQVDASQNFLINSKLFWDEIEDYMKTNPRERRKLENEDESFSGLIPGLSVGVASAAAMLFSLASVAMDKNGDRYITEVKYWQKNEHKTAVKQAKKLMRVNLRVGAVFEEDRIKEVSKSMFEILKQRVKTSKARSYEIKALNELASIGNDPILAIFRVDREVSQNVRRMMNVDLWKLHSEPEFLTTNSIIGFKQGTRMIYALSVIDDMQDVEDLVSNFFSNLDVSNVNVIIGEDIHDILMTVLDLPLSFKIYSNDDSLNTDIMNRFQGIYGQNIQLNLAPNTSASGMQSQNSLTSRISSSISSVINSAGVSTGLIKKRNTAVEKVGSVFDSTLPLVHCVSGDFEMSKGLALEICRKYGRISLERVAGDVVVKPFKNRTIVYLVTKNRFNEKPTLDTLKLCLENMKTELPKWGITRVCMPRIGCGLDKLEYYDVLNILNDKQIDCDIYTLPASTGNTPIQTPRVSPVGTPVSQRSLSLSQPGPSGLQNLNVIVGSTNQGTIAQGQQTPTKQAPQQFNMHEGNSDSEFATKEEIFAQVADASKLVGSKVMSGFESTKNSILRVDWEKIWDKIKEFCEWLVQVAKEGWQAEKLQQVCEGLGVGFIYDALARFCTRPVAFVLAMSCSAYILYATSLPKWAMYAGSCLIGYTVKRLMFNRGVVARYERFENLCTELMGATVAGGVVGNFFLKGMLNPDNYSVITPKIVEKYVMDSQMVPLNGNVSPMSSAVLLSKNIYVMFQHLTSLDYTSAMFDLGNILTILPQCSIRSLMASCLISATVYGLKFWLKKLAFAGATNSLLTAKLGKEQFEWMKEKMFGENLEKIDYSGLVDYILPVLATTLNPLSLIPVIVDIVVGTVTESMGLDGVEAKPFHHRVKESFMKWGGDGMIVSSIFIMVKFFWKLVNSQERGQEAQFSEGFLNKLKSYIPNFETVKTICSIINVVYYQKIQNIKHMGGQLLDSVTVFFSWICDKIGSLISFGLEKIGACIGRGVMKGALNSVLPNSITSYIMREKTEEKSTAKLAYRTCLRVKDLCEMCGNHIKYTENSSIDEGQVIVSPNGRVVFPTQHHIPRVSIAKYCYSKAMTIDCLLCWANENGLLECITDYVWYDLCEETLDSTTIKEIVDCKKSTVFLFKTRQYRDNRFISGVHIAEIYFIYENGVLYSTENNETLQLARGLARPKTTFAAISSRNYEEPSAIKEGTKPCNERMRDLVSMDLYGCDYFKLQWHETNRFSSCINALYTNDNFDYLKRFNTHVKPCCIVVSSTNYLGEEEMKATKCTHGKVSKLHRFTHVDDGQYAGLDDNVFVKVLNYFNLNYNKKEYYMPVDEEYISPEIETRLSPDQVEELREKTETTIKETNIGERFCHGFVHRHPQKSIEHSGYCHESHAAAKNPVIKYSVDDWEKLYKTVMRLDTSDEVVEIHGRDVWKKISKIDRHLYPSARKMKGVAIAQQLDELTELFKNSETIWDPCCGQGGFVQYTLSKHGTQRNKQIFFGSKRGTGLMMPEALGFLANPVLYNMDDVGRSAAEKEGKNYDGDIRNNFVQNQWFDNGKCDLLVFDGGEASRDPSASLNYWFKQNSNNTFLSAVCTFKNHINIGGSMIVRLALNNPKIKQICVNLIKNFKSYCFIKPNTTSGVSPICYLVCKKYKGRSLDLKTEWISSSLDHALQAQFVGISRHARMIAHELRKKYPISVTRGECREWCRIDGVFAQITSSSKVDFCGIPESWSYNGTTYKPNIRRRLQKVVEKITRTKPNFKLQDINRSNFEHLPVLGSFRVNTKYPGERRTVNKLIADGLNDCFGWDVNNSCVGHTQSDKDSIMASLKKRLDLVPNDPQVEVMAKMMEGMPMMVTPEAKRFLGTMEPMEFEDAIKHMNLQGSSGWGENWNNISEFLADKNAKKLVFEIYNAWKDGLPSPAKDNLREKREPKLRKDVLPDGRLDYPGLDAENYEEFKNGKNLAPRFIQFGDIAARIADMMVLGQLLDQHAHVKTYHGSLTGCPPWLLGGCLNTMWRAYDANDKRVRAAKWFETTGCKLTRTQKFEDLTCGEVLVACGDFSSWDGTVSVFDLYLECEFVKQFYKRKYHKLIENRYIEKIWSIVFDDYGNCFVRIGQRGSGDLMTSYGNTFLNVLYHKAVESLQFGVPMSKVFEILGYIDYAKNTVVDSKNKFTDKCVMGRIYLFEITHIGDGDDNLHFGTKNKISQFLRRIEYQWEKTGKIIRSGTSGGYSIANSFVEVSFCSNSYRPVPIGKNIFERMKGKTTMSAWDDNTLDRLQYMPTRPIAEIVGKLGCTLKMDTARDPWGERALEVTRGKLLSFLILYPHILHIRFFCLLMLYWLPRGGYNMYDMDRRVDVKLHTFKNVKHAIKSVYGVEDLSWIYRVDSRWANTSSKSLLWNFALGSGLNYHKLKPITPRGVAFCLLQNRPIQVDEKIDPYVSELIDHVGRYGTSIRNAYNFFVGPTLSKRNSKL